VVGEAARGRRLVREAGGRVGVERALLAPRVVGVAFQHAARLVTDHRDRAQPVGVEKPQVLRKVRRETKGVIH